MPWNLFTAQLIATGLGIVLGRQITARAHDVRLESLLRRVPTVRVLVILSAVVLAAVMALEASDASCQRLPLLWQRHRAVASWMTASSLFGLVSGLFASVALRTRHGQRRLVLAATLAGQTVFAITHLEKYGDVSAQLRVRRTSDVIVLQSHGATCTAATLANIARRYGRVLDERRAVRLLGTTTAGTSPGQMRYALDRLGIPFRTLNEGLRIWPTYRLRPFSLSTTRPSDAKDTPSPTWAAPETASKSGTRSPAANCGASWMSRTVGMAMALSASRRKQKKNPAPEESRDFV